MGSEVIVKVVKNKLAPPFKSAQFELEFGKGINRVAEIIELSVKHKLISKAGAFYHYNGQTFHGKDAIKMFLVKNHEVQEELTMKLREKLSAETENEPEAEATSGDVTVEVESLDSTDEEAVTAAEA